MAFFAYKQKKIKYFVLHAIPLKHPVLTKQSTCRRYHVGLGNFNDLKMIFNPMYHKCIVSKKNVSITADAQLVQMCNIIISHKNSSYTHKMHVRYHFISSHDILKVCT